MPQPHHTIPSTPCCTSPGPHTHRRHTVKRLNLLTFSPHTHAASKYTPLGSAPNSCTCTLHRESERYRAGERGGGGHYESLEAELQVCCPPQSAGCPYVHQTLGSQVDWGERGWSWLACVCWCCPSWLCSAAIPHGSIENGLQFEKSCRLKRHRCRGFIPKSLLHTLQLALARTCNVLASGELPGCQEFRAVLFLSLAVLLRH